MKLLHNNLKSRNMKINKYARHVLILLARARRLKAEKAAASDNAAAGTE